MEPTNRALVSYAFSSGAVSPTFNYFLNDKRYGTKFAWKLDKAKPPPHFVGLRLQNVVAIDRIAWGRDNTNSFIDNYAAKYSVEYSLDPDVDETSPETTWIPMFNRVAPVDETNNRVGLRNVFDAGRVVATAIRVKIDRFKTDDDVIIDELEVYGEPVG